MNRNPYIQVMVDTLSKKLSILDKLYHLTLEQEKYISGEQPDIDEFDGLYQQKQDLIEVLNQIDDGFNHIYERVRDELLIHKEVWKEEVLRIQEYIRSISEKSTLILALEKGNKVKFENYFSKQKQEVRVFKKSNQTVSNYYKNMTEGYGKDMFLDQKK